MENAVCGVPDSGWTVLCGRFPTHDGDHRSGARIWPRTECWEPGPPGYAVNCVSDPGHSGRHVATIWRATGQIGNPEPVRLEWDGHGADPMPGAPLPRPAWTPNPLADRGPDTVSCAGYPVCSYCTPEHPGPVGIPVILNGLPGRQMLAEMVAHTRARQGRT